MVDWSRKTVMLGAIPPIGIKPSVVEVVERSIINPVSLEELSVKVKFRPVGTMLPVRLPGTFTPVTVGPQFKVYWFETLVRKSKPSFMRLY